MKRYGKKTSAASTIASRLWARPFLEGFGEFPYFPVAKITKWLKLCLFLQLRFVLDTIIT